MTAPANLPPSWLANRLNTYDATGSTGYLVYSGTLGTQQKNAGICRHSAESGFSACLDQTLLLECGLDAGIGVQSLHETLEILLVRKIQFLHPGP